MSAEDALHWLTLRICINDDIAQILNEDSQAGKQKLPVIDRQIKFVEISLLWHCAALRDFSGELIAEDFAMIRQNRFPESTESVSQQQFIDLVKEVLYARFPHISNSSILRMMATYLEIAELPIKPVYSLEEVDDFGRRLFPIIVWEAGEKVKTMLRFIRKEVEPEDGALQAGKLQIAKAVNDKLGRPQDKEDERKGFLRRLLFIMEKLLIKLVSKQAPAAPPSERREEKPREIVQTADRVVQEEKKETPVQQLPEEASSESVLNNPFWKGIFGEEGDNPGIGEAEKADLDDMDKYEFRTLFHKKDSDRGQPTNPRQSNFQANLRLNENYEQSHRKKETAEGREMLDQDECRLI